MPDAYLLGVDIGTYSSKGVIVNDKGEVIGSETLPHGIDMPAPGFFEHDAEKVWWKEFVQIVKSLLGNSGVKPENIHGIGTSAIGSCVLPIDGDGKPLRPAILYGIDTRSVKEIEYLEKIIGRDEITKRCGAPLSSQASGPKILWIRNNEPEVFKKTKWFLTSQAYLVFKLTGKPSIDIYTAAGYAPLFDIYNFSWYEDIAQHITSVEKLPGAYWSCEVIGGVTSAASEETGLKEGTPVIAGTTDAAAEAISAGVSDFGDMMLMFGSSIFFILKTSELLKTEHFWSSNFLEKGTYAFLGGMSTAGSLTTWFRDQFGQMELEKEKSGKESAYKALAILAEESPPGSRGLISLPYFEGERTPLQDPKAKGLIFGLSLKHTRADIYRALLESVGFGIRHNLEVMSGEGVYPEKILAVGGGTHNSVWLQIVADIINTKLTIPRQQIGASYGDAFMAGVGTGIFKNLSGIKEWIREKRNIRPNPEEHKKYEMNYKIFRSLYERTKPLMHELTDYLLNH